MSSSAKLTAGQGNEVEISVLCVTLLVSNCPGSWSSDGVGSLARYGQSLNLGALYILSHASSHSTANGNRRLQH